MTKVNLKFVNLVGADLRYANLTCADLTGASMYTANLYQANLTDVKNLPDISMACPETGSFIGWKKCFIGDNINAGELIVKLEIPEDAKRSSAIGSKKCRCDKAKVLSIENLDGELIDIAYSWYDNDFVYKVGETVTVPNFDENRFNECASGIHFFMTKEGALYHRL